MTVTARTAELLPLPAPSDPIQRLALFAVRRMAAHGIRDAHAAQMMLTSFGINFRRPLVLLRAYMVELSQVSRRTITIAPCCTLRMTIDEARIVGILATAASNPANAAQHLRCLTGSRAISSPLSVAAAFSAALADLGRPLALLETRAGCVKYDADRPL